MRPLLAARLTTAWRVESGPVTGAPRTGHCRFRARSPFDAARKFRFTVDAFSTDERFDPRRAEARSSIPLWVWVLSLFVAPGRFGTRRECGTCRRSLRRRRPIAASRRRRRSSDAFSWCRRTKSAADRLTLSRHSHAEGTFESSLGVGARLRSPNCARRRRSGTSASERRYFVGTANLAEPASMRSVIHA